MSESETPETNYKVLSDFYPSNVLTKIKCLSDLYNGVSPDWKIHSTCAVTHASPTCDEQSCSIRVQFFSKSITIQFSPKVGSSLTIFITAN